MLSETRFNRARSSANVHLSTIAAMVLVTTPFLLEAVEPAKPIDVGSRLELLVDDYLIESMENLEFRLHSPKSQERVMVFDKPWENGPYCDYVTVFQDGELYRMYYASHLDAPGNFGGENHVACYAESRDGIHWTKPALGIVDYEGSKKNNIVLRGRSCPNFTPFLDTRPGVAADQKYKAVGGNPRGDRPRPELFVSGDAIHWRKVGEVSTPGAYDSQNVMFWDAIGEQYVFYFRVYEGRRHIARATSPDFLTWSNGQSIDLGQTPKEHLYTNATIPYFRAPHMYLAFPMRYVWTRSPLVKVRKGGVCDAVFMSSRDGVHFSRRHMEAFMRPGPHRRNWTKHSIMIAWGLLPLSEDEISLYVSQHYFTDTNHLIRAVLRTDGFVSMRGPYSGGEFTTKQISFSGHNLVINAETSAAGSIRAEILDADGKPLEGYRAEDCTEFYGDTTAHTVHWKGGRDLSRLAGKPVRVRFQIRDADLYSFRFAATK